MNIEAIRLYFLPVATRVPLKFGPETLTQIVCARVQMVVRGPDGRAAEGWGETPLSVQWVWPSRLPYAEREAALCACCQRVAAAWRKTEIAGHPLEIGHRFLEKTLPDLHRDFNASRTPETSLPWLAALVCCSPFDIALYDAWATLSGRPVYDTFGPELLASDLSAFLEPADGSSVRFGGRRLT